MPSPLRRRGAGSHRCRQPQRPLRRSTSHRRLCTRLPRCSTSAACRSGASSSRTRSSGGFTRQRSPALTPDDPILIPDGERFKNLQTVGRIYDALIRARADRASALIAIGGGVVGDIAGFAAATYLRGIPVVQVPTTLLAQVDSAIGGKVGVNHALGKNLIGAFHPPRARRRSIRRCSATLPRREFRAGPLRSGQVRRDRQPSAVRARAVAAPAALRARRRRADAGHRRVVRDQGVDRRAGRARNGLRRHLNFGHTAGHALEAVTQYRRFRHGEAVALRHAGRGGHRVAQRARSPAADCDALSGADRAAGTAAGGRRPVDRRRCSRRWATTRRSSPDGCTSCCRRPSASCEVVEDVTEDEIAAALRSD